MNVLDIYHPDFYIKMCFGRSKEELRGPRITVIMKTFVIEGWAVMKADTFWICRSIYTAADYIRIEYLLYNTLNPQSFSSPTNALL